MRYCLLSGRLFMSVITVLLFVAVTSYGNNLGKAQSNLIKIKFVIKVRQWNVIQLSCILAVSFCCCVGR